MSNLEKGIALTALSLAIASGGCNKPKTPHAPEDISRIQDHQISTKSRLQERTAHVREQLKEAILQGDDPQTFTSCDEKQLQGIVTTCVNSPYIQQAKAVFDAQSKKLEAKITPEQKALCVSTEGVNEDCLDATAFRQYPAIFYTYMEAKNEHHLANLECLTSANLKVKDLTKANPLDRSAPVKFQKDYENFEKAAQEWIKKKKAYDEAKAKFDEVTLKYTIALNNWEMEKAALETAKRNYPVLHKDWENRKKKSEKERKEYEKAYDKWSKERDDYELQQERAIAQYRHEYQRDMHAVGVDPRPYGIQPPKHVPKFNEEEPKLPVAKMPSPPNPPPSFKLEPLPPFPDEPIRPSISCNMDERFMGKPFKTSTNVEDLTKLFPILSDDRVVVQDFPEYVGRDATKDAQVAQIIMTSHRIDETVRKIGPKAPKMLECQSNFGVIQDARFLDKPWSTVAQPFNEDVTQNCHSVITGGLDRQCVITMDAAKKQPQYLNLLQSIIDYQQKVETCLNHN